VHDSDSDFVTGIEHSRIANFGIREPEPFGIQSFEIGLRFSDMELGLAKGMFR